MTSYQPSPATDAPRRGRRWPVRHPVTGRATSDLLPRPPRTTAGPREMSLCVICHGPLEGPSLLADDARRELHPACLAERLPYDAGVALVAAAALFVIPFIRVWSA